MGTRSCLVAVGAQFCPSPGDARHQGSNSNAKGVGSLLIGQVLNGNEMQRFALFQGQVQKCSAYLSQVNGIFLHGRMKWLVVVDRRVVASFAGCIGAVCIW